LCLDNYRNGEIPGEVYYPFVVGINIQTSDVFSWGSLYNELVGKPFVMKGGIVMEPGADLALTEYQASQPEKRMKSRIACDFPAILQFKDSRGNEFIEEARVANLSAKGFLMVVKQPVQKDTEVHIRVSLSPDSTEWSGINLITRGNVVRNESRPNGEKFIAIKFQGYRLN